MKLKLLFAAAVFAALPLAAQAQGIPEGASYGFHTGNRMAGPLGAVVGTVVGGVTGGINGMLGVDPRPAVQPEPVAYRHRPLRVRHHRYYRHHHYRRRHH